MKNYIYLLATLFCTVVFAENTINTSAILKGKITSNNKSIPGATIHLKNGTIGSSANINGTYEFTVPTGKFVVVASAIGYKTKEVKVLLKNNETRILNFELEEDLFGLEQVVVTGTRTFKKQTNSPVIVNIIDSQLMENVQACSLSDGLRFQTGLRVETDCQTCNYTQLRMNGLAGGYSQILINGRPIFSPLTGLYGLEQIPANMIDRVEVVRGGGSALYGSGAIGGTVNVITKIPKSDSFEVSYTHQSIKGSAFENMLNANTTVVNKNENAGLSVFLNHRNRTMYDANDDGYSELPKLKNTSFGINSFFMPTQNQKIELSVGYLNELRYGGEMVNKPAYLTQQSEERTHNVLMGTLDYQINFNNYNSSLITYFSAQKTDRDHYTGIFPEEEIEIKNHLENPPYGISDVKTFQGGVQFNHKLLAFLNGENTLTFGTEFVEDKVYDEIDAYSYLIDQKTTNLGVFAQSDWEVSEKLNVLAGVRADKHNFLDNFVLSPRVSLLYKPLERTQFRVTYGTGFRAPQAFDTDLHIAFSGGGISRIQLANDLKEERSQSLTTSINYDKASDNFIAGFTLEGFYTKLTDAFYQHSLGEDEFGEVYEKRNGDEATVKGVTLELRANYNKKVQLETGFTLQSSEFSEAVLYADELAAKKNFLRTPELYGYATLTYTPNKKFNTAVNFLYTGEMDVLHLAGAPEQLEDEFIKSPSFTELGFKSSYTIEAKKLQTGIEIFGGIKNIFDNYQSDFDSGKNRDSNYIYGPSMPRTYFVGLKLMSL
ncbi:outer membrane receptor for ferrienterochelin and colicins [Lutibacter oricola]|uniref:Outer membrane receptor for ferrienterochelin and colicins n=1 Tax=Lutibacter oricola TaxID=762486 RepID=A0A1H2RUJ0_9FLAO|nr:TonB-dependent receptor [Lutibacter oricola]SDW22948.1 outer membrane receptor for ferrienterochelin and colicins [Lutibacter oricola]